MGGLKPFAPENLSMKRIGILCCCILTLVLSSLPLRAQQPPTASPAASTTSPDAAKAVADKLNQLDQRVTAAQSAADNAWMLVSAALVLMMTGPGLALFYGGLVRHKNVLAIMMQSFALMALITVLWALVGYSLCFGGSGPVIGNFQFAMLRAGANHRRNRRTHEIFRHIALHDPVVPARLRPDGPHGLG
jgi:hypothetical protein